MDVIKKRRLNRGDDNNEILKGKFLGKTKYPKRI